MRICTWDRTGNMKIVLLSLWQWRIETKSTWFQNSRPQNVIDSSIPSCWKPSCQQPENPSCVISDCHVILPGILHQTIPVWSSFSFSVCTSYLHSSNTVLPLSLLVSLIRRSIYPEPLLPLFSNRKIIQIKNALTQNVSVDYTCICRKDKNTFFIKVNPQICG